MPATSNAEAGVNWSKLIFAPGENLRALIIARDNQGQAPARTIWTLYRNGQAVFNGEGATVNYVGTTTGLYRLKGTAYCNDSTQLVFDSTAFIEGDANVRHNLPVPDYGGTAIYLGAVYTQNVTANGGTATTLPYQIGSSTEEILLLPGTTHWLFDLDPNAGAVDDEVVVRTRKGNWCLNGLAGGLTGEDIGYDYGFMPVLVPAPIDHRVRLTVDLYKVHGFAYTGANCRVRIKCYRRLPIGVYQYERCANSSHAGGQGRRTRRWAALFTNLDIQTDVFSGLDRLGTGTSVITFTAINATSIPLMTLSSSGTPNPVPSYSGLYYTDSNLYTYYELYGLPDLAAKAVSAIEGVRPCCISLLSFTGSKPILSHRIKRLHGKLVLFLTEGVVFQGTTVTVKIWRTDGINSTSYVVPITTTRYANVDNVLLSVGEIDIDLSDYQFDETGIVADFSVNESAIVDSGVPAVAPTPIISPDRIYSSTYSAAVLFDGACYTHPVYVSIFDDNAVLVTPVGGCQDPACGPSALYCYSAVDAPAESIIVPQPFGFPAPYVAHGDNPSRCFAVQAAYTEVSGTNISLAHFTGTEGTDLLSYNNGSLCGSGYLYRDCQTHYAACAAYTCSLIVVYPVVGSPHATIEYGGRCYYYSGSTSNYGTWSVVSVASVNAVADCYDPACNQYNASGSVAVYNDTQTGLEVPVRFSHLDVGIAHYGVADQEIDEATSGLQEGSKNIVFTTEASVLVYTATGIGSMMFEFNLSGAAKQVVVIRAGYQFVFSPGIGGSRQTVELQTGDQVYLRIADPYGRLPLQYRNTRVAVRWHPILFLPRVYDTVVVPYSGSTAIRALGFCAYTTQGVYSFYGTLPFNGSMTGPVNPDSLVTITASGQEYNLLSVRAIGDVNLFPLSSLPWYSGQTLSGPFTFKFYAAREAFGAHGEMDVWFNSNGTFPPFLRAGQFDVLRLSGTYYRKDSAPTDTNRNSYAVAASAEVEWPCVYAASDGQVISADANSGSIVYNSKTFLAPSWPVPTFDSGFSYTVIQT